MNWLDDYMAYAGYDHYPRPFHLACALTLVGMAAGRRITAQHGRWELLPIIHPILIGESGSGKSAAVEIMYRIQREALPGLQTVSQEGTLAGILDAIPTDGIRQTEPLLIEASELTTLFNKMEFQRNIVPALIQLADNNFYNKKLKGEMRKISSLQVGILLGSNIAMIEGFAGPEFVSGGLPARLTWIACAAGREELHPVSELEPAVVAAKQKAIAGLQRIGGARSATYDFAQDAQLWYGLWHNCHRNPAGTDPDHVGYYSRRHLTMMRVGLIRAISREAGAIYREDLEWAWERLQEWEPGMFDTLARLRMSEYGKAEDRVYRFVAARPGGCLGGEVVRHFHSRLAGAQSVNRVLENLVAAGKLRRGRTETGRGTTYEQVAAE